MIRENTVKMMLVMAQIKIYLNKYPTYTRKICEFHFLIGIGFFTYHCSKVSQYILIDFMCSCSVNYCNCIEVSTCNCGIG